MDTAKHFTAIQSFLAKHHYLLEMEVLDRYGTKIPENYKLWVEELSTLSLEQLLELINTGKTDNISNQDLAQFIQQCQALSELPKIETGEFDFHPFLKRKLTPKKEHEIKKIGALLKQSKYNKLIDIGSGAGHLSSALLSESETLESLCVDANQDFQKIGIEKLQRYKPDILERLKFDCQYVDTKSSFATNTPKSESVIIGLHSCGSLSVDILKVFRIESYGGLINFGCCYHKMPDDCTISQTAQNNKLRLTNHALTLAAKSHSVQTLQKWQGKIRVKSKRYALHFYCVDQFGCAPVSIGNTVKEDEKLSFSDYLIKYLPIEYRIQINSHHANQYFDSEDFHQTLNFYLCFGVLRSFLARPLEIYLTLDRVLYLQEAGLSVQYGEVFDKEISPRNIGIISL